MRTKWRRYWPVYTLGLISTLLVAFNFLVERLTQEPPNYSQIEDGLWLGGYVAEPPENTEAVLNLCEVPDQYQVKAHQWEPIRDAAPAPTLEWLRGQVQFIKNQRAAKRTVYVHCMNGVSRSGMVVVAYLMARNQWSRDQAIAQVRTKRPGLRPNPAFLQLLLEWEQAIFSK
ncbi:MAG: dual specificity protein phosphatase [Zavarzinella sp.]